jgi:hypothetical protein
MCSYVVGDNLADLNISWLSWSLPAFEEREKAIRGSDSFNILDQGPLVIISCPLAF